jgi:hypothetical protein
MDPHMPPPLDGRVTLVSGAGGGIDEAAVLKRRNRSDESAAVRILRKRSSGCPQMAQASQPEPRSQWRGGSVTK